MTTATLTSAPLSAPLSPGDRVEAALAGLKEHGLFRAWGFFRELAVAMGDLALDIIEELEEPEAEVLDQLAQAIDDAFALDRGVEQPAPGEGRFAPVRRFLEKKDYDFWRSRMTVWLGRARKRQALAATQAA